jgi:hypothetical protein
MLATGMILPVRHLVLWARVLLAVQKILGHQYLGFMAGFGFGFGFFGFVLP